MNMQPDNELLRQYASAGSEVAFAELVKRNVNLVYSAALRQVGGDAHLAHDVAQNVFTDLARKAASLCRRESLTGWLYTSAYFAANKIVRSETRRREREEEFMREPTRNTSEADWERIQPILDAAMHGLKDSEREAVLLRYFENRPYAEVGAKLGVNENTARMRVERALEKLRALLAKRAITTTATLASVISANAVQVAPGNLAVGLAQASLAGVSKLGFFQMMTATKMKFGIGTLVVATAIVAFVTQQQAQQSLHVQNESLATELARLKMENANLSNQIYAVGSQSLANEQRDELLRLRAEVTRLRSEVTQLHATGIQLAAVPIATNDVPEVEPKQITLKVRYVSVPAKEMRAVKFGWAPAGNGVSLLSEEQFDGALKMMKNRLVDLINEEEVTTLSGRQAQFQVSDLVLGGSNLTATATLDVVPQFSTDSSIFNLSLVSEVLQLTGDPSVPFKMLQASNQVNLLSGETVALEDQPLPAGLILDTPDNPGPHKLLVFVTPTLIDAVGNRIIPAANTNREAFADKVNEADRAVLVHTVSQP